MVSTYSKADVYFWFSQTSMIELIAKIADGASANNLEMSAHSCQFGNSGNSMGNLE